MNAFIPLIDGFGYEIRQCVHLIPTNGLNTFLPMIVCSKAQFEAKHDLFIWYHVQPYTL